MKQAGILVYLLALTLVAMPAIANTTTASASLIAGQQVSPRKYLIKPLNLGVNTEIRARSTRNLQVRVTDENDRPVTDTPVLFLLSSGDAGSPTVGSLSGQTSVRVLTNAQGLAHVEYTAGEMVGGKAQIKAQVEGTDAVWEGTLEIISAFAGGLASQPLPQPAAQKEAPKATPFISGLVIGQLPKSSVARHTFTTTGGRRFTLETLRGKVVVILFFGAWCDTSRRQVESIRNLLVRYKLEGLEVVAMSVKDPRSTPQALVQFIAAQKIDYSVVQDVEDKHFVKFVDSNNVSVPQTLIYGRDGRLSAHYLGYNPHVGAELEQKIKDELAK